VRYPFRIFLFKASASVAPVRQRVPSLARNHGSGFRFQLSGTPITWWKSSWRVLVVRGSADFANSSQDQELVLAFRPSPGRADEGLKPGEASWLDRPLGPTEPHQLVRWFDDAQTAGQAADYLKDPDHYVLFDCAAVEWNALPAKPVFLAASGEQFTPEQTAGKSNAQTPGGAESTKTSDTNNAPPVFVDPEVTAFLKENTRNGVGDCRKKIKEALPEASATPGD
jgi:hypothetical protein